MLIYGLPGEDFASLEATKEFMRQAKPDTWILSTFTPLPGSPIWNCPEKYGIEIDKSKAAGWFFDTNEMPSFLSEEVKAAYREFREYLEGGAWRNGI